MRQRSLLIAAVFAVVALLMVIAGPGAHQSRAGEDGTAPDGYYDVPTDDGGFRIRPLALMPAPDFPEYASRQRLGAEMDQAIAVLEATNLTRHPDYTSGSVGPLSGMTLRLPALASGASEDEIFPVNPYWGRVADSLRPSWQAVVFFTVFDVPVEVLGQPHLALHVDLFATPGSNSGIRFPFPDEFGTPVATRPGAAA